MPFTPLTGGSLERMLNEVETGHPILQVLGMKSIKASEGNERYRLLVSDGKNMHGYAMIASQMAHLVKSDQVTNYCILKVLNFTVSNISQNDAINKRVLVLLDVKILHQGDEVREQIGNPVQMETSVKVNENSKPNAVSAAPSSKKPTPSHPPTQANLDSTINDALTHPISSLSPYQNKWVIKVRVTNKSNIRTWNNAKGEGQLFSMDLMDESGEIRATAFRDQVDKYYDMIKVGKVYFMTKCVLKPANKQFSTLKNDYEMTFTSDTIVTECEDEVDSIPAIQYDLVPISSIANMEPNSIVDVAGVCMESGDVQTFTARSTGRELRKREVVLGDQSRASISLTLWGDDAEKFDASHQPVVVIKGARITEFNGGKNLSVSNSGNLQINPNIPEGHKLRNWYDNGGNNQINENVSAKTGGGGGFKTEWMTVYEAKEKKLGFGDKPDYFQIKGDIHLVKQANAVYKACPQQDCNKKVVDQGNGTYRCEKCNTDYTNFKYRLMMNAIIGDWSCSEWATCFSDSAEKIMGQTSEEIGQHLENKDPDADNIFGHAHFTSHVFKLRVKNEFYGDTSRTKVNVVNVAPVVHKEYNEYLVNNLKRLTGLNSV